MNGNSMPVLIGPPRRFCATIAAMCLLWGAGVGCSGGFFVEGFGTVLCQSSADCGLGFTCVEQVCDRNETPCAASNPDGYCPLGRSCDANSGACLCEDPEVCGCPNGSCQLTSTTGWCDCAEGEACDAAGTCVGLTEQTRCSGQNPWGACADGDVCVGGACIPIVEAAPEQGGTACSLEIKDGLCLPGLVCQGGVCVPRVDYACETVGADGRCPPALGCAEQADSTFACGSVNCKEENPTGRCDVDQFCYEGVCQQVACAFGHPAGLCADGLRCSFSGECLQAGECGHSNDCLSGMYCASNRECMNPGQCDVTEDCAAQDEYRQGYVCDTGSCIPAELCQENDDCITAERCGASGRCLGADECFGPEDCPTNRCSTEKVCLETNACRSDDDCSGDDVCSSSNECISKDGCADERDCPPGHACVQSQCEPSGTLCDSNDFVTTGCVGDALFCCAPGKTCCAEGEICSSANSCITAGSCVEDGDCQIGYADGANYFACGADYTCEPTTTCQRDTDCNAEEYCGSAGSCLPGGRCASHADCAVGEQCLGDSTCGIISCGFDELAVGALAKPNMLIILDHSGSMQLCGAGDPTAGFCGYALADPGDNLTCNEGPNGETETRWTQAKTAIGAVLANYGSSINFGLTIYPEALGGGPCDIPCNWFSCNESATSASGLIDVPVAAGTSEAITNRLASVEPGGGTPTAEVLRSVIASPANAGLAGSEGQNVVLLITDGEAKGDQSAPERVCSAPPCDDGILNGDESDQDCGGSCGGCGELGICRDGRDCASGVCRLNRCYAAHCANDVHDSESGEIAKDCGGSCPPCPDGEACTDDSGCLSGKCVGEFCAQPTCNDGLPNGSESDEDCGGGCDGCDVDKKCEQNSDCASSVCQGGTCRLGTCASGEQDAGETDTDCGGPCGPCGDAKACGAPTDCVSGICDGTSHCAADTCADGLLSPGETDVDCGGATCPKCLGGSPCGADTDCASGTCVDCTASGDPDIEDTCKVLVALDRLYLIDPSIRTYVVGFGFETASPNLNCYAARGRTPRRDQCPSVGVHDCDTTENVCYYEAEDTASLTTAFDSIISDVASCSFTLPEPPQDPSLLYLYFDTDPGTGRSLERIERHLYWSYDRSKRQVDIFGTACDRIKNQTVDPILIEGCQIDGGG